ncbi:MAG TPA: GWxTD domain-containing protein [Catalimonadaceae bacterium]|nr:GWxTD domain-containing protein [Catalimonadaceae bacterium]
MKKNGLYLLFGLIISFLPHTMSQAKVAARIEYACFPALQNGGQLLLVVGIDGSELKYITKNKSGYQSRVTFAIVVNDSLKNYFAEKQDIETPILRDSSQFGQQYAFSKEIPLPYGKFSVSILAFENNGIQSDTVKAAFPIEIENPTKVSTSSEMLFVESRLFDTKQSIFQQDIRTFRLSDFYSKNDSILSIYGEMSGLKNNMTSGSTLLSRFRILDARSRRSLDEFGKFQKVKFRNELAQKADLNIKNLPTGRYLLVWDLVDSTLKVVSKSEKLFSKSNPDLVVSQEESIGNRNSKLEEIISGLSIDECRNTVASLLPISRTSEQPTLEYLRKKGSEKELRNYLANFWTKHEPENPASALLAYRELMALGGKKYATQTMPAYQTDRGRVLLQYGQPNLIENEYSDRFRKAMQNLNTVPYEIWYFYNLEKPVKQNDVIFVFVQENRGNENYRLIHSTGIGEVRNREWRKVVETNATYNFDRMDANDRYDPNDSKKFR